MKKILMALATLLAAGFLLTSCSDNKTAPADDSTDSVSITFSSTDIDGNNADESVFTDKKLTMVNIWATYCGPCIKEMPDLGELNDEYADEGFQIIGIPVDVIGRNGEINSAAVDTVKEIVGETGADYLHILPSDTIEKAFLNSVIYVPTTIFVDENGNQVGESYVGSKSKSDWIKVIDLMFEKVS